MKPDTINKVNEAWFTIADDQINELRDKVLYLQQVLLNIYEHTNDDQIKIAIKEADKNIKDAEVW